MANPTPSNSPATRVRQISFAFPFRKRGQGNAAGAAFTDEHEFHKLLTQEPNGSYSVSAKGIWHGGIHVSADGAGRHLDLKHGVRCMADGEVVAWRLNRTYAVSELPASRGNPAVRAPYSTGFALVRHTMEFPKDSKLTFFSLYMHLQDLAGYESDRTLPRPGYWWPDFKVTEFANHRPAPGRAGGAASNQAGLRVRATHPHGTPLCILPHGAQVTISKREGDWGKIQDTHGAQLIPPTAGTYVESTAAINGWIFLGEEGGHPMVEEIVPDSSLERVVIPATPYRIKSGELIGHLGRYDSLSRHAETRMVHIEMFCGDGIKSLIEQNRNWVRDNGSRATAWKQLGHSKDPTILRVDKNTKLYNAPNREGQEAPQTAAVQVAALSELVRHRGNQYDETTPGPDGLKLRWWKIDGADTLGRDISGWVREQNFPGGRVTREFAQSWVDFDASFEDPHDPTHTMFSTLKAYIDFSMGANVPTPAALANLSPLMKRVYRAIYPTGDGSQAANELCVADDNRWRALRQSRLIIKHESEWANPGKWNQLIQEIEKVTGPQPQHGEEQKRIEKLVWWDDVKVGVRDLPGSDAFHIHPIGLVGNFLRKNLVCKKCGAIITLTEEFLAGIAPGADADFVAEMIHASVELFPRYGVNSCRQVKHLLAQAKHETQGFREFRESLRYVRYTGRSLYEMAPTAINNGFVRKNMNFPNDTAKIAWIQDHLIANDAAYGEHCFGANEQPGKDFRGRGLLHLTHYDTYKKCAQIVGFPIDSQPELVESSPRVIIETGLWFWSDRRIGSIADDPRAIGGEGVKNVTRPINSGFKGLSERQLFKIEISRVFNQALSSGCIDD